MTSMILTAIVLYLAMMIFYRLALFKQNKSTDDFYLGGRKLGPFVTAMSAEASDMSGWLLMDFGTGSDDGLAEAT